jgi:hypothetical protein
MSNPDFHGIKIGEESHGYDEDRVSGVWWLATTASSSGVG